MVRSLAMALIVSFVWVPRAGAADRAAAVREVTLPTAGRSFAINPETGGVLVAPAVASGPLALYPAVSAQGKATDAITRDVGPVRDVVHKRWGDRGRFLALSFDGRLHMLDDATLEPAGKPIALTGEAPRGLVVAAGPRAPYAFYTAPTVRGAGRAYRVNLETGRDEGPIDTGRHTVDEAAVSADGTILYGRPGTAGFETRAWRIVGPTSSSQRGLRTLELLSEHSTRAAVRPDALGQFCGVGREVYTADRSRKVAAVEGWPAAWFADRPVFVGMAGSRVTAYSTNTFRPLDSADVGALEKPAAAATPGTDPAPPPVLVDPANSNVLVCVDDRVSVMSLGKMAIGAEPLLFADMDPAALSVTVGADVAVPVTIRDARVKAELASGPAGMKLEGGRLVWRPAVPDIGAHTVVLRLTGAVAVAGAGGAAFERKQELALTVRRPAAGLPFVPGELALSADGKTVAALLERPVNTMDENGQPLPAETYLAVVDVATLKVTATRTLPLEARGLAVDGRHVYVALTDADAFLVLARADLSEVKRVYVAGRVEGIQPAGDDWLFVESGGRGRAGVVTRFRLPALTPDGRPLGAREQELMARRSNAPRPSLPVPVAGGYFFRGALYDAAMAKPMVLFAPDALPALARPAVEWNPLLDPVRSRKETPVSRWGVAVVGTELVRVAGQSVGRLPGFGHVALDDAPAAVSLRLAPAPPVIGGRRSSYRVRVELVASNLVSGAPAATTVLSDDAVSESQFSEGEGHPAKRPFRLLAGRGLLIGQVRDRLYAVPTALLPTEKLPVPLHFVPQQDVLVADQTVTLAPAVRGGKSPVRFAMSADVPGVELDPATGRVTVRPDAVAAGAQKHVMRTMAQNGWLDPRDTGEPRTPAESVQDMAAAHAVRFTELTGRAPRGLGAFVPVLLTARDGEEQVAVYPGGVLVDLPVEPLIAAATEARAKQVEERAARAREAQPGGAVDPASLGARVADLERRNREVEAQLREVRELIGKPAGATRPTTRPAP
ncbi:MAG: hypothetical protein ACAI43_22825 [Phycisphaerae bacterium]